MKKGWKKGKSTFNAATVKVIEVCRNVAKNGSIDYVSILDSYNSHFNESGKGKIVFRGNMAYSDGTLSGLFFYVNIIQANSQAYFPRTTINFFTIFISWLNLDLGIENCFYDGMDMYVYSWFQFLFPFYVWFLVGCIILACHYSQSVAKRFGQNPVAVLAALLLMS